MKYRLHYLLVMILLGVFVTSEAFAQSRMNINELLLFAEKNPAAENQAKTLARESQLPIAIYLEDGTFIEALGIQDGEPLYGVMRNAAHPSQGGEVLFFNDIAARFDLSTARLNYGNFDRRPNKVSKREGYSLVTDSLLLIPESSDDRVMAFDPKTGDLVDMDFFPPSANLSTPIQAAQSPWGTITISDQLEDVVHEVDTSGAYLGILAPAGGPSSSIMDNIRGHAYHPLTGKLLVTSAGGANSDAVVEFDQSGNYLGNFIANNSGGMDGPWGIWFRENDVLVSASSSSAVHRYDSSGTFLSNFAPVPSFPEQVIELPDGNVAVGNFSGTQDGVVIFSSDGTFQRLLTGVSGNRGVWMLGNGNIMTTNGNGVHELDYNSGILLRTIVAGVSARFISLYTPDAAIFALTPTNLTFPQVQVGSSESDTVMVVNDGGQTLQIFTVISDHPDFSITPDDISIAPGDTQAFIVTFEPSDYGLQSGNIVFFHNAAGAQDTLTVDGIGVAPGFTVNPSSHNFGSVQTGMSVTDSVTVHNPGNATLEVTSIVSHNSLFTVDPGSGMISEGDSMKFGVTFTADTMLGLHTGIIEFHHTAVSTPDTLLVQADVITGITTVDGAIPARYELQQNYPNPFNPATNIRFSLPKAETVTLSVYNLRGQRAAVLLNEAKSAGNYEIEFDGSDLSSGVYFYQIKAGKFTATRKMLLMK